MSFKNEWSLDNLNQFRMKFPQNIFKIANLWNQIGSFGKFLRYLPMMVSNSNKWEYTNCLSGHDSPMEYSVVIPQPYSLMHKIFLHSNSSGHKSRPTLQCPRLFTKQQQFLLPELQTCWLTYILVLFPVDSFGNGRRLHEIGIENGSTEVFYLHK